MRDVIAILLAGGVGSRLNVLVHQRAKPAVPFGGIYRIIDFTLSNVANSKIPKVAVLTQYKPLSLMDHIEDGSPWDLCGRTRGIRILPPKTGEKDWDWYQGTADAVRQNIDFITNNQGKYVLILSGDHVYYMDYRRMVEFHEDNDAMVTIAMIRVPWEDTSQFGTAIVDERGRITEWEEKAEKAKSNLASMGIYVFDKQYLMELLAETKEVDFGHHIIPRALGDGDVFAYPFEGYWRDVGTINAYWEANMDLLDDRSGLEPGKWRIMTNLKEEGIMYDRPPIRVLNEGRVKNSILSPGCVVAGTVENSVISPGVIVNKDAVVRDSVVMHDVVIKSGAQVLHSILDKQVVVGRRSRIGQAEKGITIVGKKAVIPGEAEIGADCIVYPFVEKKDFKSFIIGNGETIERTD